MIGKDMSLSAFCIFYEESKRFLLQIETKPPFPEAVTRGAL